jgi:NAD(P)-dependent dehydrogenase (short-subunit alcohol dehydrogenase family)
VTGGGRGIGRAICRRFAREGHHVVAVARTSSELEETREIIKADGGTCATSTADLTKPDAVAAVIASVDKEFGGVSVLVNCAGVAPCTTVEAMSDAVFEGMLAINVSAMFYACRAVWPIMKRQNGGVIINISSMAAFDPFPGLGTYGASKAWVNTFTKGLAGEGRSYDIRAFSIAPGAVDTSMLRSAFPDFPEDQMLDSTEIANVAFAVSGADCRYASGETLIVKQ